MTNKLTRNEFMKTGIVAALGLLVPKFIANIGGYVTGLGRGSPMIMDNWGLTIDLPEREPKTWNLKTQEEFEYAFDRARRGDTVMCHPGTYSFDISLNKNSPHIFVYGSIIIPKIVEYAQ